jgi:hypothetical protein
MSSSGAPSIVQCSAALVALDEDAVHLLRLRDDDAQPADADARGSGRRGRRSERCRRRRSRSAASAQRVDLQAPEAERDDACPSEVIVVSSRESQSPRVA